MNHIFDFLIINQQIGCKQIGLVFCIIEILEPVLRGDGQEMWQALDRIISAKNSMEGIVAKEMYIRGFLDYERLMCEKDSYI